MALVGALVLMQIAISLALPQYANAMEGSAQRVFAVAVLLILELMIIGAAYYSLRRDTLPDDIGWIVGLGMTVAHGWYNLDYFDSVYARGDPTALALILLVYFLTPVAVMLTPMIAREDA